LHGVRDQMTARRRRGGSESEQAPLIIASGGSYSQDSWSQQTQALRHANSAAEFQGYLIEDTTPKQRESRKTPAMISRDRTTEFMNAIRSLQGRHMARTVAVRDPRKAKYIQSYAEFMMIARWSMIHTNFSCSFQQN